MNIEQGTLVEILPTRIWIEDDIFGRHFVMAQHDGDEKPFEYCVLHYSYRYTSNAHIDAMAEHIAREIGATGKIEHRCRDPKELREAMAAVRAGDDEYASWATRGKSAKEQQ